LVICHGGPTGATQAQLSLGVQYWTSRGIGVVDVNYGGSTGYGREYRQRLNGNWGVVDVMDCINAAKYLIAQGQADPRQVAIRGGSAGGYTTMRALTWKNFFAAGANYFGLTELEAFVDDTHKFEARYLDNLVGPYPARKDLYYERSPVNFVDNLNVPVIVLQGLDDKIVPPSQSEIVVEALKKKGVPHAYLAFAGEQHGFRKAETIIRSAEAELYFYGRVFGFTPADEIEPVPIENL
jgi:dipeptidyl aminopeptidase/acylaminoacyl peptidase